MFSLFNRLNIGKTTGLDIVEELINSKVLYILESREKPIKTYAKQLIKKELRDYTIEPKLYFKKPFFRFWFLFIEPLKKRNSNIDIEKVLINYRKYGYRLSSSIFENLSQELLIKSFKDIDAIVESGSYWDRYSEFDIYSKCSSGAYILGECKYKNRPVTQAELKKIKFKAEVSNLKVDKYAIFSKNGFSHEFYKKLDSNTLLYTLNDFKKLIF